MRKRNCHPLMKARGDSYAFAPCSVYFYFLIWQKKFHNKTISNQLSLLSFYILIVLSAVQYSLNFRYTADRTRILWCLKKSKWTKLLKIQDSKHAQYSKVWPSLKLFKLRFGGFCSCALKLQFVISRFIKVKDTSKS